MTIKRELDGIYFRVKRGKYWESICFSDLSDEEMDKVLEGHSVEWLKNTCKILGRTIKRIGDEQDIVGWQKEEEMAMQELMSMMTEAAKLVHYNKEQKK